MPSSRGRSRSRGTSRQQHRRMDEPVVSQPVARRGEPQRQRQSKAKDDAFCSSSCLPITATFESTAAAAIAVTPDHRDTSHSLSLYTSSTPPFLATTIDGDGLGESKDNVSTADDDDKEARYLSLLLQAAERPQQGQSRYQTYRAHLETKDDDDDGAMMSWDGMDQQQQKEEDTPASRTLFAATSSDDDDEPLDIHEQEQLADNLFRRLERNYSGSPHGSSTSLNHRNSPAHFRNNLLDESTLTTATILNLSPIILVHHRTSNKQPQPDLILSLSDPSITYSPQREKRQYHNHSPAPSNTSSLSDPPGCDDTDKEHLYNATIQITKRSTTSPNTTPTAAVITTPRTLLDESSMDDDDDEERANPLKSRNEGIHTTMANHTQRRRASSSASMRHYSRCIWAMFGIGSLLLLTAIALAVGFVVANRAQGSSDRSASTASTSNNQELGGYSPSAAPSLPSILAPVYFPVIAPSATDIGPLLFLDEDADGPTNPPRRKPHPPPSPPHHSHEHPKDSPAMDKEETVTPNVTMQQLVGWISPYSFDEGASMHTPGTPQYQAIEWLVFISSASSMYASRSRRSSLIQRYAMATIFFSTNGLSAWNSTDGWLSSDSECSWWAHQDDDDDPRPPPTPNSCSHGKLTKLSLQSNILSGALPPEIGMLTSLELLDLSFNSLTGTLPSEIGYLTDLDYVLMHSNHFTGNIPESWATLKKLRLLRVDDNDLSGLLIRPAVCSVMFDGVPRIFADCGGPDSEVTCPDGGCCRYCCIDADANDDTVKSMNSTNDDEVLFARGSCECVYRGTSQEPDLC